MIPYSHQHIDEADIEAVVKVLKSDWLTQGPDIAAFEKSLAAYCDAAYAVVVPNGTAALHLAYMAAGLGAGDEIITSANTFVATANMAIACGAKPILCDIRSDTYNIDETKIELLINDRTKAIVPVHFGGHPCEMDAIWDISRKHKLLVIEDACHALGARYKGKKIGGGSDLAVFSFHPVKPITTGEGGAILTNNQEYYEIMLRLRTHGIAKDPAKQKAIGGWFYEMTDLGYNYRITDIQCALGLSQLSKLDGFHVRREQLAQYYFRKLATLPNVIAPAFLEHIVHSWHLFPIRVKPADRRKEVFSFLQANGIGVQVHYIPVYQQPYYQKLGYASRAFPNTEAYYDSCISLPLYPDLTEAQVDFVVAKLAQATA